MTVAPLFQLHSDVIRRTMASKRISSWYREESRQFGAVVVALTAGGLASV